MSAAPAAVFTLHVSGCTVLGTLTGAIIDSGRKDRTPRSVVKIHSGSSVKLLLRNGSVLRGSFGGRQEMSPEAYAIAWSAWRDTAARGTFFPAPGDTVLLTRKDGTTCSGRLAAYEIDAIVVATQGGHCVVAVDALGSLAMPGGRRIEREVLRTATRHAAIPLTTVIRLNTKAGTVEVPLHDVRGVEGPAPAGGKVIGFVVGLGVDVAFVAAIAASSSSGCTSSY